MTDPTPAAAALPPVPAPYVACLTRRMGWATPRTLRCPAGHRLREDTMILDRGAIRCKHREPLRSSGAGAGRPAGGGPECGRWLYVVMCYAPLDPDHVAEIRAKSPHDASQLGEAFYVVEVTYPELQMIRARRLPASVVFELLGATFPT